MSVVDDETTNFFHGLMGKVEIPLSNKHRLSVHVLRSGDRAEIRDVEPGVAQAWHGRGTGLRRVSGLQAIMETDPKHIGAH